MSIKNEVNNHIAKVVLARPEKHNALNEEMITNLISLFEEIDKNQDVRVVVIEAEGKSFCAGADIKWQSAMIDKSLEENIDDIAKFGKLCEVIFRCSKPVIAKVHGSIFGGGIGIISSCDIVLSLDNAKLSLSEVKLGLVPGVISPFVLRKISPSSAYRYFLTAEVFDANIAKELGLVSEVFKSENDLSDSVEKLISQILQNGPEATAYCKKMINEVLDSTLEEGIALSPRYTAERRLSDEGKEGMKSFLEKRKPSWVAS